ncbi:MAG: hypothetical protein CBE00_08565 [Planctomycetaceae bacterium TMED240]|nr:MAG: hypothetical protein CBE00_08565 [Planctomycetaceae bacterium TMED240]
MIDTPQALVSYPGGTGGEWLAIQIGKHDKYYSEHTQGEHVGKNKWRLRHNWKANLHSKFMANFDDRLFDNSPEWWENFKAQSPNKEEWYKIAQDKMKEMQGGTIPVYRSHHGWYDTFWKDMFTDFKTITIKVDPLHKPSVNRVEQNYLTKVLHDKNPKDIPFLMPTSKTYKQYHHKLNESWHVLDFKKMFLDKDYFEYLKMCEFLDMQPWASNKWIKTLNEYLLPDEKQLCE